MIDGLKPYPAYKDSGVPWLGEVPQHWEVRRTKTVLRERSEKGHPNEPLLAATQTKGVVRKERYENRTVLALKDLHLLKLVEAGDFVISLRSFQGGIEYARERGIISPAYTILYPIDAQVHPYLAFLFKSTPYIENLQLFVTGIRQGQNIDYEKLSRSSLLLPPLPEQTAIVRFLDWAERRIRRVIRARRRRIKLLEEHKQALIHQAVTGRIDVRTGKPYPAYKPSGVEWLGKVPAHWEVARLRYVTSCLDGRRVPLNAVERGSMQGPYPYWGANKIIDYINDYLFDEPLVLLGEDGAPFFEANKKVAFFVEGKIWVNNHAHVIRCKGPAQPRYLVHVLNLTDYTRFVDGSTRDKLTQQAMGSIPVILPRLEEQTAIVEYLDAQTAKIDAAIAADRKAIDLLQEFRTRLIADVVTGKLDVREVAAKLPDEPPEEEEETVEDEGTDEAGEVLADAEQGAVTEEGEP